MTSEPVVLVLLTRIAQLAAAPVTLWIIATRRPLAEQGLYFVFWNVQALTQLMELGVGNLIVNFASHESPRLSISAGGRVTGDPSSRARLFAMLREGHRWYGRFALGFVALVGVGGGILFRPAAADASSAFLVPWAATVVFVAAYLTLIPRLCTIEGSDGLLPVQRMRLAQIAAATATQWIVLWVSGALWAVAAFAEVWLAVAWIWLRERYPELVPAALMETDRVPLTESGTTLASVQRRSAATWLAIWAAPQILTPIVLVTHGAAAAGRIGMTLAIAMAPSVLAGAWLQARYPRYAALVSRGESVALASLARRASLQATLVGLAGITAVAAALWWLARVAPALADRALTPIAVVLLGITSLFWLLAQSLSSYLRAWRQEPLMETIIGSAVLVTLGSLLAAVWLPLPTTVAVHAAIVPLVLVTLIARWYSQDRRRDVPHP